MKFACLISYNLMSDAMNSKCGLFSAGFRRGHDKKYPGYEVDKIQVCCYGEIVVSPSKLKFKTFLIVSQLTYSAIAPPS